MFSVVALNTIVGNAQIPTRTPDWVNIKDPKFGAIGNGSHDDTAAIQAAIDYAFAHNRPAVYCPAGTYKTSNTIWLDPPTNMRAAEWTGTGHFDGAGNFIVNTTVSGATTNIVADSFIYGSSYTGSPVVVTGGSSPGPWMVNVPFAQSSVALTASNPSVPTQAQFTMSFFGDPMEGISALGGCRIQPTFNNAVAFMVGTGQGMRVSDFSVNGPNSNGDRGNLNPHGVGIGLAGGSGGSSGNLIQDTQVSFFYSLYSTDANGLTDLDDSNSFINVSGSDAYRGIYFLGTQSYVDSVINPRFNYVTIDIDSSWSKTVHVFGGNLSSVGGANDTYTMTATAIGCGATTFCVSAVLSGSSFPNIPNRDNFYYILTPHYGLIPLIATSWTPATNTLVLQAPSSWLYTNYGSISYWYNNRIRTEAAAQTTLQGIEVATTAKGAGITLDSAHVENNSCTKLIDGTVVWGADQTDIADNVYFNYDPSAPLGAGWTPVDYCQQAGVALISPPAGGAIIRGGGNWAGAEPTLIDTASDNVSGSVLGNARFNVRVGSYPQFSQIDTTQYGAETVARGAGRWDGDYFLPSVLLNTSVQTMLSFGELSGRYCGDEPCPSETPNMSPTLFARECPSASAGSPNSYATVAYTCGSLGTLGTYPPVPARGVFRSLDWNTGTPNKLFLHSGHGSTVPGWSWGQNLTETSLGATTNAVGTGSVTGNQLTITANTSGTFAPGETITGSGLPASGLVIIDGHPGTTGTFTLSATASVGSETITAPAVAWSYDRGSSDLYLDPAIMKWMFQGLGFSLNNGESTQPYTVTGVYPALGYVSVIWAGNNSGNSGVNSVGLQGGTSQIYSCSSSCAIAQAPFAWTAY